MNRLIKATSKVEVDPDAVEKLKITRADFLHALEHDIKPVCLLQLTSNLKIEKCEYISDIFINFTV